MRVGGVQEVELAPAQWRPGRAHGSPGIGLHAPYIANMSNFIVRSIASVASQHRRRKGKQSRQNTRSHDASNAVLDDKQARHERKLEGKSSPGI